MDRYLVDLEPLILYLGLNRNKVLDSQLYIIKNKIPTVKFRRGDFVSPHNVFNNSCFPTALNPVIAHISPIIPIERNEQKQQ